MHDDKLLRLLHKDPNAGMEQLMDQYAGLVYAVVKSKLCDSYYVSSDIEDCVADVFSNFYTNLCDYNPNLSSIKSYLCVIARNQAHNILLKRCRQGGISLDDKDSFLQAVVDEVLIDSELADSELRREVIKAVEDLGEPDSSIILRKYYFNESSKDIAKALRLSVSNVDTRAHRALTKLRNKFGGNSP